MLLLFLSLLAQAEPPYRGHLPDTRNEVLSEPMEELGMEGPVGEDVEINDGRHCVATPVAKRMNDSNPNQCEVVYITAGHCVPERHMVTVKIGGQTFKNTKVIRRYRKRELDAALFRIVAECDFVAKKTVYPIKSGAPLKSGLRLQTRTRKERVPANPGGALPIFASMDEISEGHAYASQPCQSGKKWVHGGDSGSPIANRLGEWVGVLSCALHWSGKGTITFDKGATQWAEKIIKEWPWDSVKEFPHLDLSKPELYAENKQGKMVPVYFKEILVQGGPLQTIVGPEKEPLSSHALKELAWYYSDRVLTFSEVDAKDVRAFLTWYRSHYRG